MIGTRYPEDNGAAGVTVVVTCLRHGETVVPFTRAAVDELAEGESVYSVSFELQRRAREAHRARHAAERPAPKSRQRPGFAS